MSTEIDEIFARWTAYLEGKEREVYEPESTGYAAPHYEPLPISAGPKAITLEEYRKRQKKPVESTPIKKQKKKRADKQYQKRKTLAILYKDLNLATDKKQLILIRTDIKRLQ